MNREDEVIEILDDFEDTITIPPINKNVVVPNIPPVAPKVETQTPSVNSQTNSNLGVSDVEEIKVEPAVYNEVKNLDNVNYAPIEPEKEEIKVDTDVGEEDTKSGLGFVIVLFILLAAFIIALPYISNLF